MNHEFHHHIHLYQPPVAETLKVADLPLPELGESAVTSFSDSLKGVVKAVGDSAAPFAEVGAGLPGDAADSPLLKRINEVVARLKARGAKAGEIGAAIRRIIHSPATAILVALTPTRADDLVLEILKGMFPE